MVVDAAVVGLAGQRGVGDGDDRRREPGALRVRGQQHRPERRLVEQSPSLVEPQQRLGAAVDAGHGVGVGQIRSAGFADRAVDAVDLHGRVLRPQPAVGDETRQRARADLFAELRHLRQARRAVDRPVHQHRPCRPRRLRIQIVADHDIRNTLPRKGIREPGGRPSGGEQPLHRIECADRLRRGERDRVAHPPRAVAEHLQRLVVAGSPHLRGERRAGHHEHASRRRARRCARRASRPSGASTAGSRRTRPAG